MADVIDLNSINPTVNPHLSFGQVQTTPTNPNDIEQQVRTTATKYGLDPDYIARIAKQESSFNPMAINKDTNASGVMQLMPDTAKMLGVQNVFNPQENIEAGVKYYKQLLDQNGGDHNKAAILYGGFKKEDPTAYLKAIQPPGIEPKPTGEVVNLDSVTSAVHAAAAMEATPNVGNVWNQIMQSLGPAISAGMGPVGALANPEERQQIKENLPLIGAAVAPELIPAMGGLPLISRAATAGAKIAASALGGATGEIAKRGIEGNLPSFKEIPDILSEQGPQAAIQAIFEIPGLMKAGPKFADTVYKKSFRLTPEEVKNGVHNVLQDERVLPNGNAPFSLAARDDEVRNAVNSSLQSHIGETISNQNVIQKMIDFVQNGMPDKAFKSRWGQEGGDILNEWLHDHPTTDLDLNNAEKLKADLRRQGNVKFGDTGTYKNQMYKQLSKIIDDEIETKAPELKDLHNRWKGIIDARPAVDRFAAEKGGMLSPRVASAIAMGAAGAGAGMYTVHHPWEGAGIGALTGILMGPQNYARVAMLAKNNPELLRALVGTPARSIVQGDNSLAGQSIDAVKALADWGH